MIDFKPCSKVALKELAGDKIVPQVSVLDSNPSCSESPANDQQPRKLQNSGKVLHQPHWFMYDGEVYQAETMEHDEDPFTYDEAMSDVDAKLWKKAMND